MSELPRPSAKMPWTAAEDRTLFEVVQAHGAKRWTHVASFVPGRSGKQCRERWHNHVNPDVKKGQWGNHEDEVIKALIRRHGTKWAQVASFLPGRTDNAVKNRYNSYLRQVLEYEDAHGIQSAPEILAKIDQGPPPACPPACPPARPSHPSLHAQPSVQLQSQLPPAVPRQGASLAPPPIASAPTHQHQPPQQPRPQPQQPQQPSPAGPFPLPHHQPCGGGFESVLGKRALSDAICFPFYPPQKRASTPTAPHIFEQSLWPEADRSRVLLGPQQPHSLGSHHLAGPVPATSQTSQLVSSLLALRPKTQADPPNPALVPQQRQLQPQQQQQQRQPSHYHQHQQHHHHQQQQPRLVSGQPQARAPPRRLDIASLCSPETQPRSSQRAQPPSDVPAPKFPLAFLMGGRELEVGPADSGVRVERDRSPEAPRPRLPSPLHMPFRAPDSPEASPLDKGERDSGTAAFSIDGVLQDMQRGGRVRKSPERLPSWRELDMAACGRVPPGR